MDEIQKTNLSDSVYTMGSKYDNNIKHLLFYNSDSTIKKNYSQRSDSSYKIKLDNVDI